MPDINHALTQLLGRDVSRETLESLEVHLELLKKWNPAINLVSQGTLSDGWTRHILDSAQVYAYAGVSEGHWLDFGTGGGFPGLVCAILARDLDPNLRFTLVESDKRKASFLLNAARSLNLNTTISAKRIESLPPQQADIVSARAVASLRRLLEYAEPHLKTGGKCLFPKGENHPKEIEEASDFWSFKLSQRASITESNAAILVLGEIQRV